MSLDSSLFLAKTVAMPTRRQLEIFLSIATHGGLRRAADALDTSQPLISKQLKALERNVGGELFLRKRGHRAELSHLGIKMLGTARQAVAIQRSLVESTRDHALGGLHMYARHMMLSAIRADMERLHERGLPQDLQFSLVDDKEDIIALIEQNAYSFTVIRTNNVSARHGLSSVILRDESCAIYASAKTAADLKLGRLEPGELSVLVPTELPEIDAWSRRWVERAGFVSENIQPGSRFIDVLIRQIGRGRSAGILLDWYVRDNVEAGTLVPIAAIDEPCHLLLVAGAAVTPAQLSQLAEIFCDL